MSRYCSLSDLGLTAASGCRRVALPGTVLLPIIVADEGIGTCFVSTRFLHASGGFIHTTLRLAGHKELESWMRRQLTR
jgi:hypothetical protein